MIAGALAFVRSGWLNIGTTDDSIMRYVGDGGWIRSRTAGSSIYAHYLSFNVSSVTSSGNSNRFVGFPLRCLYPGSA